MNEPPHSHRRGEQTHSCPISNKGTTFTETAAIFRALGANEIAFEENRASPILPPESGLWGSALDMKFCIAGVTETSKICISKICTFKDMC
jgi:hypothetical protein